MRNRSQQTIDGILSKLQEGKKRALSEFNKFEFFRLAYILLVISLTKPFNLFRFPYNQVTSDVL